MANSSTYSARAVGDFSAKGSGNRKRKRKLFRWVVRAVLLGVTVFFLLFLACMKPFGLTPPYCRGVQRGKSVKQIVISLDKDGIPTLVTEGGNTYMIIKDTKRIVNYIERSIKPICSGDGVLYYQGGDLICKSLDEVVPEPVPPVQLPDFTSWDKNVFDDVRYLTGLLDVAANNPSQYDLLGFIGGQWRNTTLSAVLEHNYVCSVGQVLGYSSTGWGCVDMAGNVSPVLWDDSTNNLTIGLDELDLSDLSQTLSLSGDRLTISDSGSSVDLSVYRQSLNFDTGTGQLSISGSNAVDLSTFWDNTDNQTLTLSGNTLSISGGNSVTFTNWDTDVTDDVRNLTDLQDVTVVSPSAAQVLRYDGSVWVNSLLSFLDLSDTPSTYGTSGYLLETDGTGSIQYVDPAPFLTHIGNTNLTITNDRSLIVNNYSFSYTADVTTASFLAVIGGQVGWSDDVFVAADRTPDGGYVAVGRTDAFALNGARDWYIVKFNVDGTLDTDFGVSGVLILGGGGWDEVFDVEVMPDGSILVAGAIESWSTNNRTKPAVVKLTPQGDLDYSFGGSGVVVFDDSGTGWGRANVVKYSPKGYILVGGVVDDVVRFEEGFIARLLLDGTLDPGFATTGFVTVGTAGADEGVVDLIETETGGVVAVGYYYDVVDRVLVVKLTEGGDLDRTFAGDGIRLTSVGGQHTYARGVLYLNGNYIVVGSYLTADGDYNGFITAFASDGDLAPDFALGQVLTFGTSAGNEELRGAIVLSDGGIVVVGYTDSTSLYGDRDIYIAKVTPDGILDSAFGVSGSLSMVLGSPDTADNDELFDIVPVGDDMVVVGYSASYSPYTSPQPLIARIKADGSFDAPCGAVYDYRQVPGSGVTIPEGDIVIPVGISAPLGLPISNPVLGTNNIGGGQGDSVRLCSFSQSNTLPILRVDSTNSVGIGTSTPVAGLQVESGGGSLAIRDPNISYMWVFDQLGIGPQAGALQIGKASWIDGEILSKVVTISPDGMVGIGTVTPTYDLSVNGTIGFNNPAGNYLFEDWGVQVKLADGGGSHYFGVRSSDNLVKFMVNSAGWTSVSRSLTVGYGSDPGAGNAAIAGRLGVGTNTPAAGVHVYNKDFLIEAPPTMQVQFSYLGATGVGLDIFQIGAVARNGYVYVLSNGVLDILRINPDYSLELVSSSVLEMEPYAPVTSHSVDLVLLEEKLYVGGYIIDVSDVSRPFIATSLGGIGETVGAVLTAGGKLIYVIWGDGAVDLYDITGIGRGDVTLTPISSVSLPDVSDCYAAKAYQGRVYFGCTDYSSGIVVGIDVSDPYSPILIGQLYTSGESIKDIEIQGEGGYLLLADYLGGGLTTVDLDLTTIISSDTFHSEVYDIEVYGQYIYVAADYDGLRIYNNSSSPNEVGWNDYDIRPSGLILDPTIVGSNPSAADSVYTYGDDPFELYPDALIRIDTTDPTAPLPREAYTLGWSVPLPRVVGDYLYSFASGTFEIWDISDLQHPERLGNVTSDSFITQVVNFTIAGNYAYVAVDQVGLYVIDITNKANPTIVGFLSAPAIMDPVRVEYVERMIGGVVQRRVYVLLHWDEVITINVDNPVAPSYVGTVSVPGGIEFASGTLYYVGANRSYLVTSGINSSFELVLKVFDLSDPDNPAIAGGVNLGPWVDGTASVAIRGGVAYIPNVGGTYVVSLEDPANPVVVNTLTGGIDAIADSYLFIKNVDYTVDVYDLSDPYNPVLMSVDFPRMTYAWNFVDIIGQNILLFDNGRLEVYTYGVTENKSKVMYVDPIGRRVGFFVSGAPTPPEHPFQIGTAGDGTYAIANAWYTFSDRRYKEDIEPVTSALDIVRELRGVRFRWKETGKSDIGFIAQEVKAVVPEVVSESPTGYLGVEYSKLVPVLVEAIKELDARVGGGTVGTVESGVWNIDSQDRLTTTYELKVNRLSVTDMAATEVAASTLRTTTLEVGQALMIDQGSIVSTVPITASSISVRNITTEQLTVTKDKGVVKINAGDTEVTVNVTGMKKDAVVLVTQYDGPFVNFRVERNDGYFRIILQTPPTEEVVFGWLVVR